MRIHLFGAAGGEVTGSTYLVQTDKTIVAVDCGMFQGSKLADSRNRIKREMNIKQIEACVITHAHLDHTGRLPLAVRRGYKAPIYATTPTIDLTSLILQDSARIQQGDIERKNRKLKKEGLPPLEPLYDLTDVQGVRDLFKPIDYDRPTTIAPGVSVRLLEAGHILGSASVEMTVEDAGKTRVIVFSGDIGPRGVPILRDAMPVSKADMVFLESTYGGRDHRSLDDTIAEFYDVVKSAIQRHGKLLVPTFAVGRAQLLLVLLAQLFRRGGVKKFPIYLDSPMAIEANRAYTRYPHLFDEELTAMRREAPLSRDLTTLQLTATAAESRGLNKLPGPCMIIAGAGMCNAGRILHHLEANIGNPETAVLIIGYQAHGSLGRRLIEGAKQVTIHGNKVNVRGSVHTMGGFSAHAGHSDLMRWFDAVAPSRPRLVVTHGEDKGREALAGAIREKHGIVGELPDLEQVIEL